MKKRKSTRRVTGKMFLFALVTASAVYSCKKITEKDYGGMGRAGTTPVTRAYDDDLSDDVLHQKTEHLVAVIWNHTAEEWDAVKPTNATDAVDYMEAVLNYTHGDATKDHEEMETFSQDFTLTGDADGTYTLNGYTESFNQMSEYIVNTYNNVDVSQKTVIAIKLDPKMEVPNEVTLTFYLGKWFKPEGYPLKSFGSPAYDIYKYDKVSGHCSSGGPNGACKQLEDYGRYNMEWHKTNGGTMLRTYGYYSKVGSVYVDITTLPLLTGPNRPASFTAGFLDFQVFAFDSWKGLVSMPCINMDQMNYYLNQIKPLFTAAVAGLSTREFINLTVNPKYKSGGSFTNLPGWGDPNKRGLNTTGPVSGGGDIVTRSNQNASGKSTYYEHYYIFDHGRYINAQPTYRRL